MNFFDSTLIYPIFDVESIGDGPRVPRAHLEVVLTQLLVARARALYRVLQCVSVCQQERAVQPAAQRVTFPGNRVGITTFEFF